MPLPIAFRLCVVSSLNDDSDDEVDAETGILKQTKVAINLWRELQKSKTPGGQTVGPADLGPRQKKPRTED